MERIPVSSSNVADIGYDEGSFTLEVGFISGTVYQYLSVPPDVYDAFMAASSKGVFLNQQIKPFYAYVQVG